MDKVGVRVYSVAGVFYRSTITYVRLFGTCIWQPAGAYKNNNATKEILQNKKYCTYMRFSITYYTWFILKKSQTGKLNSNFRVFVVKNGFFF